MVSRAANLLSNGELEKLKASVERSRQHLAQMRNERTLMIRQFVGKHFGDGGSSEKVPMNLMEWAINIYLREVVAYAPEVLVVSDHPELQPTAEAATAMGNALNKKLKLGKTLRLWALDAMFTFGILKVGEEYGEPIEVWGQRMRVPDVYVERVSPDDWVHDVGAKSWNAVTYCGGIVTLDLGRLKEMTDVYDAEALAALKPDERRSVDETGTELTAAISGDLNSTDTAWKPEVRVQELYLPQERLLLTVPVDGDWTKPLRLERYEGPEGGPYHLLHFGDVPDQIMPLSPAMLLLDLHLSFQAVFRKLDRQASRQKDIGLAQKGHGESAETILKTSDGEVSQVENPEAIKQLRLGGPAQENIAWLLMLKKLFGVVGGNLDILSGAAPQSDTLGQDKLLDQNASKRTRDMQERTVEATRGVTRSILWHAWNDPVRERSYKRTVPGTDIAIAGTWTPDSRAGDWLLYDVDIVPYSMSDRTPAERLQALMQIVQGVLLPMAPDMQAQGITLNFEGLVNLISRYGGMSEVQQILNFAGGFPTPGTPGPMAQPPARPAQTTRTNVRISKPGASPGGGEETLMRSLMGTNPQEAEMDGVMRN